MRLAALCSAGKDSAFALWRALEEGHEIKNTIVMMPERRDSWMFHQPDPKFIDFFENAIDFPITRVVTSGEKREELVNLKSALEKLSVEGLVHGAVESTYQKERIEKICESLGLTSISPLWKKKPFTLLRDMIKNHFSILITSVSAGGLDERWLGRKMDEKCVKDLEKLHKKYGIHPTGEGGEYETAVIDAPFMKKKIDPVLTKKIWKGDRGHLEIEKMRLLDK